VIDDRVFNIKTDCTGTIACFTYFKISESLYSTKDRSYYWTN